MIGAHVALLDYVSPSSQGTTWGLGGTCVNVGCIPKKLFHLTAQYCDNEQDALQVGFAESHRRPDWDTMVTNISNYIRSLNFKYRGSLMDEDVEYLNAKGSFVDNHTVHVEGKDITADHIVIATGGRPLIPDIPGAREFGITSDDLFRLKKEPGKTLIVGASYIALECAGFLNSFGYDTSVMVRSRVLRRFDEQMAQLIQEDMTNHGVHFLERSLPDRISKEADGKLLVEWTVNNVTKRQDVFDTVMFATGRRACTDELNLSAVKLFAEPDSGKIVCPAGETTRVPNIHVIGDARYGNPELTPVAIKQGKLLADRLFGGSSKQMDYSLIPTTVFTPLEYSCVGMTEEEAVKSASVDVYHMKYNTLEMNYLGRMNKKNEPEENICYSKVICMHEAPRKVLGVHILGPNSGDIIQGIALSMKLGVTKEDMDDVVPIHPTHGEEVFSLSVTKEQDRNAAKRSC
ncbi:thioredoxin reductase mitochondrial [Blastocystis sp. subtype 4]|uniref:thioredoxin reductase mitochondrial n=1 Tax=Blastocystis sp. subtype 4 TaxID=944170 RepID=UPI0007113332|nr:thioredoxin reductase mitochondrial [Blastocystis sp. subtype 4]KNB42952.1 thioredoxin reductase mitochondrial [Blastocystis sp. subtype 4]|eukprot:XP_014526395.1 thioredoxin reductase mitochondrial [Blastocystis sp. subtype 4]